MAKHGHESGWQYSKWYYLPIALVILSGYIVGFIGWYRCGVKPEVFELNDVELYGALFSLGLTGGAMNCSKFFGEDVRRVMYEGDERLPNWLDPFGYAFQIIGGGFTGVMFYLLLRIGMDVVSSGDSSQNISIEAAWISAFAGGFATNKIKDFIVNLVTKKTDDDDNKPKPGNS